MNIKENLIEFYNVIKTFCDKYQNVKLEDIDTRTIERVSQDLDTIYLDFLTLKEMYVNISESTTQFFGAIDELLLSIKIGTNNWYEEEKSVTPISLVSELKRTYTKEFNSLSLGAKI